MAKMMDNDSLKDIVMETIIKLLNFASMNLPDDVEKLLRDSLNKENNMIARHQISNMLENLELSKEMHAPLCQDTGIPMFYLTLGENFPIRAELPNFLAESVRRATISVPLRPNAVHPLTRMNSKDNTGIHVPYIEWEVVKGDKLDVVVVPKGFGGENNTKLGMLVPGVGLRGVKEFILDSVIEAGGKPCPPTIIGIGVGLGSDGVLRLARRAAIRPLKLRNRDPKIAALEEELLKVVNETGIGPMGLGGRTTSLAVNIEVGHTHTGALPVGVIFHCWAARRASAIIHPNGSVEFTTNKLPLTL